MAADHPASAGTATASQCPPARSPGALAVRGGAAARRPGLERTGELDQAQELAAIAEAASPRAPAASRSICSGPKLPISLPPRRCWPKAPPRR